MPQVDGNACIESRTSDTHPVVCAQICISKSTRFILQTYSVPYPPFIVENFMLMRHKAHPHVANSEIQHMRSLVRGYDLNSIEYLWNEQLARAIR